MTVVTLVSLVTLILPIPSSGLGCNTGYYCVDQDPLLCHTANASCLPCPAGRYAENPANSSCKACPLIGLELDKLRNLSAPVRHCESCAPGLYAGVIGYPLCQSCPTGRYNPVWNATWCTVCTAGRFSNKTGTVACDDCPLGGAIEDPGGTEFNGPFAEILSELRHNQISDCKACPKGKYHDETVAKGQTNFSKCILCPRGKYNDDNATDIKFHRNCTICPKGSYGDILGETSRKCKECPSGTYNDLTGSKIISDCTVCGAGKYVETQANKAVKSCKKCPEGTYLNDDAADASKHDEVGDCIVCGQGKYNPLKGMQSPGHCLGCDKGFFNAIGPTDASAHLKCLECPAGYYQDAKESIECKKCDVGTSSNSLKRETPCEVCEQGRYTVLENSVSCTGCPAGLHGGVSANTAAGRSSKENACSTCVVGKTTTSPAQNTCSKCPIKTYLPLEMVGEGAYCIKCDSVDTEMASECPAKSSDATLTSDCGHSSYNSDGGCKTCGFGQFGEWDSTVIDGNSNTPMATCTSCTPGKYAFGGDSAECKSCPKGWYSDSAGAGVCTPCPSGKYSDITGQKVASKCIPCGKGEYGSDPKGGAVNKDTGCRLCPKGTHSSAPVASDIRNCLDCPRGKFSESLGSENCQDCAKGKFGPRSRMEKSSGSGGCEDCEAGLYSNHIGSNACKKCIPGEYQEETSKEDCKVCVRGQYAGKSASKLCKACPEGFSQPSIRKTSCVECTPGKDNRYTGSRTCDLCTSGMFEPNSASTGCKECPKGFYQEYESAAVSCKSCEAGKFQKNPESQECNKCPKGFYTSFSESTSCTVCPEGYSAPRRENIRCSLCPSGKFTKVNDTECSKCPAGKYRSGNEENYQALICTNCAEGSYESEKGKSFCKICESGRFSNTPGSVNCTLCAAETFTDNINSTSCKDCAAGGTTFGKKGRTKCALCPTGKYGNAPCKNCSAGKYRSGGIKFKDAEECVKCAAGYYQNEDAKSLCLQCDPGKSANESGAKICTACSRGMYSLSRQKVCTTCPIGFTTSRNSSNSACQRCVAGKYGEKCKECPPGQFRGEDEVDVTKCLDCPRGKHTDNKGGKPFCFSCSAGTVANSTGQAKCSACEHGKFQGDKGRFECEYCTHDQKQRSRLIDGNTKASCLKTPWVQAGDCLTSEFLNDSAGWSNRMNWSCTRGDEKRAAVDMAFNSICSNGAACDKWGVCNYWGVDKDSGEMECPEEITCNKYIDFIENQLSAYERLALFRVRTFKTTISNEEVNASALYDCCRGIVNIAHGTAVGYQNVSLQLKSVNMQCNVIRPRVIRAVHNTNHTNCNREKMGFSGQQFVAPAKKTQLWSHSWVSEEEEDVGGDLEGEVCSPYAYEYGCTRSCKRKKRRFKNAKACHNAICNSKLCPATPDGILNGKRKVGQKVTCEGLEPFRGYFVDKLEYDQEVEFPAPDPSKYYEPEEYNCFCFGDFRDNLKEWTVFDLDANLTVLNDLSTTLKITNRVNSSGPVSVMQLGHKAGFWNVTWGSMDTERWKNPYFTECPYRASCLSSSDAETFYGHIQRRHTLRFGMDGAPAWHKYDLNTEEGKFYLSRDLQSNLEFKRTDILLILAHSTPNRTDPYTLFQHIDGVNGDERLLKTELERFVEEDTALRQLFPTKANQTELVKAVFDKYDGNGDGIIKLHMEWLSRSCTPTTTGPMCASCKKGYYRESRNDANCKKCTTSATVFAIVLFFSALLIFLILGYLLHRKMSGNRQKKLLNLSMGLINEMLSYFQVSASMVALIAIPWPPLFEKLFSLPFINLIDIFNLNLVSLMRLDCTIPSSWSLIHTISVYSLIPMTAVAMVFLSFTSASNRVRMLHRKTKHPGNLLEHRDKMKRKRSERKKSKKQVDRKNAEINDDENVEDDEDVEDDEYVDAKEMRYMLEAASAIEFVFDSVDYNHDGFMDEFEFRKLLDVINYGGSGQKGSKKRAKLTSTKVFHMMRKLGGQPTARGKRLWRLRKAGIALGSKKLQKNNSKFGKVAHLKHRYRIGTITMQDELPEGKDMDDEQQHLVNHDHGKAEFVLLRGSVIRAAEDGKIEGVLGSSWIFQAQMTRVYSTHASIVLYLLFIMHAPITQKLFFYFSCIEVDGRWLNKGDYSLECTIFDSDPAALARAPDYGNFIILVIIILAVYSFGFPGYAISRLIKYRNRLHTPDVTQRFGFLYSNSRLGAEAWLIMCLMRKMILIGLPVFFPNPTSASIFCVTVCVLSCTLLNYLQPHRIYKLFVLQLVSFIFTTLKYLSVILQNTEEHKEDMGKHGYRAMWLPIIIDTVFAIMCSGYILMIVYQAITGATSLDDASIDMDEDSSSDEGSSEEEWDKTFSDADSSKNKMKKKLKKLKRLEAKDKKLLFARKVNAVQRLALRVPESIKRPKLKRANSGHAAAPQSLVRWFEKVRVGLGSQLVEKLASMGITHVHDFLHMEPEAMDSLKLLMKKTERKRFKRGVDLILKRRSSGVSVLTGHVNEIKSLDGLIESCMQNENNEENIKALKERRSQLKAKLKAKVDIATKMKDVEKNLKQMLNIVAEEGTGETEQNILKSSIKNAKEELASAAAQLEKLE